jgi:hypothetical protein
VPEERENKPTTVMRRDDLVQLVNATAAPAVSAHTMPRAVLDLDQRERFDINEHLDMDIAPTSPWLVLAIIGGLLAMFIAIVASS